MVYITPAGSARGPPPTFADATLASIATLDNDSVYIAYSGAGENGGEEDTFALLFSADGEPGSRYRLPVPRAGMQRLPHVTAHKGIFAAVAYGGSRGGGGSSSPGTDSVDLVNLDFTGSPMDADPPIVDNELLGTAEAIGNQRVIVAGGRGDVIAVLYNAEQLPTGILLGAKAKMILLKAGSPPCPPDVTRPCGPLIPFHTTGPAANRLNVVIRPANYFGPGIANFFDGRLAFLRQVREQLIVNLRYGARQHRTRYRRLNLLVELENSDIPMSEPFFGCPSGLSLAALTRYQTEFPWVKAVGEQLNPGVYYDSVLMRPNAPLTSCANPDDFANRGGSFYYPGYTVGVMEHELSHVLYGLPDEIDGGAYGEVRHPGPFPSQYSSLAECQTTATAAGWNPNDCQLACVASTTPSCGRDWYTAELRPPPFFPTLLECLQWRVDHSITDPAFSCSFASSEWKIPGLDDLMVSPDSRFSTASVKIDAPTVRGNQEVAPSFQRACERRALFYLDDPRLLLSPSSSTPKPFIVVGAQIDGVVFSGAAATLVNEIRGPQFASFGPLRVVGFDSDNNELTMEHRGDVRVSAVEQFGSVRRPDGHPVSFSVDVVPVLRRVRVLEPFSPVVAFAPGIPILPIEHVLLDFDLGPTIVAACANASLPAGLCATFDSDGDGCRDVVDPEPLVPETTPPVVTLKNNGNVTLKFNNGGNSSLPDPVFVKLSDCVDSIVDDCASGPLDPNAVGIITEVEQLRAHPQGNDCTAGKIVLTNNYTVGLEPDNDSIYVIHFSVSDHAGNKTDAECRVLFFDPADPKILTTFNQCTCCASTIAGACGSCATIH